MYGSKYSLLSLFAAWEPALRTGKGWKEYLLFDFKVNARLTKLRIGSETTINSTAVRPIDSVTIEASNVAGSYYPFEIDRQPDTEKFITFNAPITARFAKIVITPKSSASAESSPIAVNQ